MTWTKSVWLAALILAGIPAANLHAQAVIRSSPGTTSAAPAGPERIIVLSEKAVPTDGGTTITTAPVSTERIVTTSTGEAPAGRATRTSTTISRSSSKVQPVLSQGVLAGRLIDLTRNHGRDRRIMAPSLGQRRDLYVYLPPNYDKSQQYPVLLYLHGFNQDEREFLALLPDFDAAIATGQLAPMVIVAPDGSLDGNAGKRVPTTFFVNCEAGQFEDYVLRDVLQTVSSQVSLRQDQGGRLVMGTGPGGFAAFSMAIRHRPYFGSAIGLMPTLNLRYAAQNGPQGWRHLRNSFGDPTEKLAPNASGLATVGHVVHPIFGNDANTVRAVGKVNPAELIDRTVLRNGEVAMMIGVGEQDEWNCDGQSASFVNMAKQRGIDVRLSVVPGGHNLGTVSRLLPETIQFINNQFGKTVEPPSGSTHIPTGATRGSENVGATPEATRSSTPLITTSPDR